MKRSFHPTGPGFEEDLAPLAFSEAALTPVYELNAFFLGQLTTLARDASPRAGAWQAALQPELLQLSSAARSRIARCPVCLVDAGFQDERRWTSPASDGEASAPSTTAELPLARSVELTQMTVTLAWSIARSHPEAACIIFGLSPQCARLVAMLGVHRIPVLAERNAPHVRPAWADDPEIWRHLLNPSAAVPPPRLPPLHVRAMQRQLAEVSLATSASQPFHPPCR
jgi:hypothetical protein